MSRSSSRVISSSFCKEVTRESAVFTFLGWGEVAPKQMARDDFQADTYTQELSWRERLGQLSSK